MKGIWLIIGLAVVAGCTGPNMPPPAEVLLLRNPTANIGSQADVSPQDLAGRWAVRQAAMGRWPGQQTLVQFDANANGFALRPPLGTCDSRGLCSTNAGLTEPVFYQPGLPGRFVASDPDLAALAGLPREIWVYWMDFDDRTMAIGDPGGRFVAILDRSAIGGADRITAARDILDWYGYDLSKVTRIEQ